VTLKLNGTHHILIYANGVNLFGDNINIVNKNTDALTNANKEVSMEVNTGKTKHILLSRHQNAGKNDDSKTANRASENLTKFRYLGTRETHQNLINEELIAGKTQFSSEPFYVSSAA
jgi:hypothetical protein